MGSWIFNSYKIIIEEERMVMKTLLFAEYKKLYRSKLMFLLVFALIMTLGIVFLQGQFSFDGKKYIDTFG